MTLRRKSRSVHFTPDTVDNENMGKKKSKVCCIYSPKETGAGACCSDGGSRRNAYEDPHFHCK